MVRILFFCLFVFTFDQVRGNDKGSLIVTYQTDLKAERLDRIRFWVKDAHNKRKLYPKENGFIKQTDDNTRMVVIEDLDPGTYTVEFLIPNKDNRFKQVPIRTIEVTEGNATRVDQRIKVRKVHEEKTAEIKTGSLIVFYDTGERRDLLEKVRFSLTDDQGKIQIYPIEGELVEEPQTGGLSFTIEDLPVGNYALDFFIADSEEKFKEETINFEVPPGKTETIHKSLVLLPSLKEPQEAE